MSLRLRTRGTSGHIEPCLPSPAELPPSGDGWLHEIRHDGFRIMARRDGAGVRLDDAVLIAFDLIELDGEDLRRTRRDSGYANRDRSGRFARSFSAVRMGG
jgi:ATP-dependent DNA ligase